MRATLLAFSLREIRSPNAAMPLAYAAFSFSCTHNHGNIPCTLRFPKKMLMYTGGISSASGTVMMKNTMLSPIFLLTCAILGSSMTGCVLEDLIYAGPCPPEGTEGELSYIAYITTQDNSGNSSNDNKVTRCERGQDCYTDAFLINTCPIDYSSCNLDKDDQFYCISICPQGQLVCEGRCVNPKTDHDFCGAQNTCSDQSYGCCTEWTSCDDWQDCKKGKCVNRKQNEGDLRCKEGKLERYSDDKWITLMSCPDDECDDKHEKCRFEDKCRITNLAGKDITIENGKKACNSDNWIIKCIDGTTELVEKCVNNLRCGVNANNEYQCLEMIDNDCQLNESIIKSGSTVCEDGKYLTTCVDGVLSALPCPIDNPNDPEASKKTYCSNGQCVIPMSCEYNNNHYQHNEYLCDGARILQCINSNIDYKNATDCSTRKDGHTYCRNAECIIPNDCTKEGATFKHGAAYCDGQYRIQCLDGSFKTADICNPNTICTPEACIPHFDNIKDLNKNYNNLINPEVCHTGGEIYSPADIVIKGVVTAKLITGGGLFNAFFIQDPNITDGVQAGIKVYCGQSVTCSYSGAGSSNDIQIGDYVQVTANSINSYYCQMQIAPNPNKTEKIKIEKLDSSPAITPIEIDASVFPQEEELQSASQKDINSVASSIYNGTLVTLNPAKIQDIVTKSPTDSSTLGWNFLDINKKTGLVGNAFYKFEPEKAQNYQLTGIIYYYYNKLQLVPRDQNDIVKILPCQPTDNAPLCRTFVDETVLYHCQNGEITKQENCTSSNKICDQSDPKNPKCREAVTCSMSNNNYHEGDVACVESSNAFYTCAYSPQTQSGEWVGGTSCRFGCNPSSGSCYKAPIEECQFVSFPKNNMTGEFYAQGVIRVKLPDGSTVSPKILCTSSNNLTTNIENWSYTGITTQNYSCRNCGLMSEYFSTVTMPNTDGDYTCVAAVTVTGGKRWLCPNESGLPAAFDNKSQIGQLLNPNCPPACSYPATPGCKESCTDEEKILPITLFSRTYTVSSPVLAYWSFNNNNAEIDLSSIKQNSTFSLKNSSNVAYNNNGYDGKAVSADILWPSSDNMSTPTDTSKPYWEITVNTTYYKDIHLSFYTMGSGNINKTIYVAYLDAENYVVSGEPLIFNDSSKWHLWSADLPLISNKPNIKIGIFPFVEGDTKRNIRIDEVRITGTPMN